MRWAAVLVLPLLAACRPPAEVDLPLTLGPTRSPSPVALPAADTPGPQTLVVCLREEPDSLYLYGAMAPEASVVLEALYDGPVDVRGHRAQAVILEKTPSLEDGDARIDQVGVGLGAAYLNPVTLLPDNIDPGDPYLPAGCESMDCVQRYPGGTVTMEQMTVEFRIREGIRWSDGQPVVASDSVFSFDLDRHRSTPSTKFLVDRTASYQAVDARTVRWVGIPGFLDDEYALGFWSPLPRHVLGGLSAADLLTAEASARQPIGWGAYALEEWRPGEYVHLRKNPLYHRAAEGLPLFDALHFRFLGGDPDNALAQLLTGECDVLDEGLIPLSSLPRLRQYETEGRVRVAWSPGAVVQRMDFNLTPAAGEPSLFEDLRTRRAIAQCIDREAMVQELLAGWGEVPGSYLSPTHPASLAELTPLPYDSAGASALLEEVGWIDDDGAAGTPRRARGVPGVPDGTPFEFTYLTSDDAFPSVVAEAIRGDLVGCGISMRVEPVPAGELFAGWPEGLVFGRRFEAVGWAWPTLVSPLCESFAGREIPSDDRPSGINASGFSDPEYDRACDVLLLGRPEGDSKAQAARRTQEIFAEQVPAVPLFSWPRVVAHGPTVCGLQPDPTAFTILWNLESLETGPGC